MVTENDIEKFLWAYDSVVLDGARDIVKYLVQHGLVDEGVGFIAKVSFDKHVERAENLAAAMREGKPPEKKKFGRPKKKPCKKTAKVERPKAPPEREGFTDIVPRQIIGFCPKCSSIMRGMPMSKCEFEKSGRVFYKECSACTYYAEIFKKRNKFKEIEGG
jgi:hypothetical protein